jgi:hypothetical protein
MFTLEYAKNPIFSTDDGKSIFLVVKWEEFNEEHSFSATSFDSMPHGVELYNRAISGEFGPVGPFVFVPAVERGVNQPTTTGAQTL